MKFTKNLLKLFVCALIITAPNFAFGQTLDELNNQIENKKQDIDQIKKQMATYEKSIIAKQSEAASLKNQLLILENKIAKTQLDIKATQTEISQVQLEIRQAELKIIDEQDNINKKNDAMTDLLQQIQQSDENSALKMLILNDKMSDFFNEVEYTKDIQNSLQDALSEVKARKKDLETQKQTLEQKEQQLVSLKNDLDLTQAELSGENSYKNNLLASTKSSEKKFQDLYAKAKAEQQSINAQLASLEKTAREQLAKKQAQGERALTDSTLDWPVNSRRITTSFHDPEYPFRYLFEHPAIDIATAQGTSIKAPADGYVLKAVDAGYGYSYISVIHANGISTLFGHVNKIYVKNNEYVTKGEVIGASGGMPGTKGAGNLTTGPHLHFEVRVNGIPVNALDFLP